MAVHLDAPESADLRLYLGRRGYGKSTLLAQDAARAVEQGRYDLAVAHAPYGRAWADWPQWDTPADALRGRDLPRLARFVRAPPIDVARFAVQQAAAFRVLLLFDELDQAGGPVYWRAPLFYEIVHYGRHLGQGVSLWGSARRPQSIPKDLWGLADEIVLFRLSGYRELEEIDRQLPDDDPPLSGQIATFARYEYTRVRV